MGMNTQERADLLAKMAAEVRAVRPEVKFLFAHVNEEETDDVNLYASIVLDSDGNRVECEQTDEQENKALNIHPSKEVLNSWDGWPVALDVETGVELTDEECEQLFFS